MNNRGKTGVLLINLGTPDSPSVPDVRKYLREFLMDRRVIDIPFFSRWMLVNLIIAPFRAPKSAKVYQQLWQERGSPLLFYGEDVKKELQKQLGDRYVVALGMRYQNPGIEEALQEVMNKQVKKIIVIPLFPQYASATTGSVMDKVMEITRNWEVIPEIDMIANFFENAHFIKTFAALGKKYLDQQEYDHIIFSYHGIPERQIRKSSVKNYCQLSEKCCSNYNPLNQYCYRAQCFATSRLLAKELNIPQEKYSVTFQSRLGKDPWLQPYTDEVIKQLPGRGKKRVLAFSPSFIADCLETTIEVGEEFKEEFMEAGGEHWQLVESLNAQPMWIETLKQIVLNRNQAQDEAGAKPASSANTLTT